MEKIKQALERARQERTTSSEPEQRREEEPSGGRDSARSTPLETRIEYSKTRTIEASVERLREKRIIVGQKNDAISDAYKFLRTHVLQRMRANGWNALAITSPMDGNGKTVTAINLAINLAREVNQTVLLVDLDLRRPSIRGYFVDEKIPGISDYLLADRELSEILFHPGLERLVILPGDKSFANSSEMLSSPKVVQLVEELKTRYPSRLVLFDMPPLLTCDDVLTFLPNIDAVMLVVEEGETKKAELARAYDLLQNTNVIGTVLNKSAGSGSAYGY